MKTQNKYDMKKFMDDYQKAPKIVILSGERICPDQDMVTLPEWKDMRKISIQELFNNLEFVPYTRITPKFFLSDIYSRGASIIDAKEGETDARYWGGFRPNGKQNLTDTLNKEITFVRQGLKEGTHFMRSETYRPSSSHKNQTLGKIIDKTYRVYERIQDEITI